MKEKHKENMKERRLYSKRPKKKFFYTSVNVLPVSLLAPETTTITKYKYLNLTSLKAK